MRLLLLVLLIVSLINAQYVGHKINQSNCKQVIKEGTYDCRWHAGLWRYADKKILGGTIAAYQIWSYGKWSDWYVPGVNDIDSKYNPYPRRCSWNYPVEGNTLRRTWSYFYDHWHKYIICFDNPYQRHFGRSRYSQAARHQTKASQSGRFSMKTPYKVPNTQSRANPVRKVGFGRVQNRKIKDERGFNDKPPEEDNKIPK